LLTFTLEDERSGRDPTGRQKFPHAADADESGGTNAGDTPDFMRHVTERLSQRLGAHAGDRVVGE
jgi:hypothetical protein